MSDTTLKCKVCRERPVNPMIGGIEPRIVNGVVVSGNKSYCSRLCMNLNTQIDLQFCDADTLARIANRAHQKEL